MEHLMIHPIEIEVHYVLPTIRKCLAIELKRQGKNQKDIAKLLFVRESTVSQYINDKRASKITFDDIIKEQIRISANKIKDKNTLVQETQRLMNLIRKSKAICQIHKQFSQTPCECDPYEVGCIQKK